jgi:aminoglycoside phosphotransferase (APT) family kinase protein
LSDTPDLGPIPERITVDEAQVRRLIEEQFPQWAGHLIEPVANGGWDNWTFHLGTEMVVRLPSAAEYSQAVKKEHRWLPALAPQLPLPIPVPLAKGEPGARYPYSWSIYRWLDGVTATSDRIADPVRFAVDLAGFLAALQSVDPTGGPQPGVHNWFRGGTLRTYAKEMERALAKLAGHLDVDLAREIWGQRTRRALGRCGPLVPRRRRRGKPAAQRRTARRRHRLRDMRRRRPSLRSGDRLDAAERRRPPGVSGAAVRK